MGKKERNGGHRPEGLSVFNKVLTFLEPHVFYSSSSLKAQALSTFFIGLKGDF